MTRSGMEIMREWCALGLALCACFSPTGSPPDASEPGEDAGARCEPLGVSPEVLVADIDGGATHLECRIDFGITASGTKATASLTFRNQCENPDQVEIVDIQQDPKGRTFAVEGGMPMFTLPGSTSISLPLSFTPQAPGTYAGRLDFTNGGSRSGSCALTGVGG